MKLIIFITLIIVLFTPLVLNAQRTDSNICPTGQTCLPNPLTGQTGAPDDVNVIIGKVINAVLGIVGSLALVMFIYGGFVWMTARGNREAITKGKDIIVWAVIGLVVIFMSYAAVRFILVDVIKGQAPQDPAPTAGASG